MDSGKQPPHRRGDEHGDPSRKGESRPRRLTRPGIFGVETEYAVLWQPDQITAGAAEEPPFRIVEEALFESLLDGRRAAESTGLKGGYFLENGGLVHLEVFVRNQSDTRVLEIATPECRSPEDALIYSRAFDAILEETSAGSARALERRGYGGRIAFAKNNVDARGMGYGCHENYLIHHQASFASLWLILLLLPPLLLTALPTFAVLLTLLIVVYMASAIGAVIRPLGTLAVSLWRYCTDRFPRVVEHGRALFLVSLTALLWVPARLYASGLRRVAFGPFLTGLTPLLVTRQILTGSGRVNFRRGVFELSQRAELTRWLATMVLFGKRKTIFDLKSFLFDPWQVFRPTRKLSITLGDSNLADIPCYLKLGMTALVIEMIESGERFSDLCLRHPVRAFQEVSRGGPWKQLRLRDGRSLTAIELQREYLRRARQFHQAGDSQRAQSDDILRLWDESLERLADRPQSLADTLDWVAKKSLLDHAVLSRSGWKQLFAWGRVFEAAGLDAAATASDLRSLVRLTPWWRRAPLRRHIRKAMLEPSRFALYQDLYFQVSKIDLRYHELGDGEGYQRRLESDGLIDRLVDDDRIERATRKAPRGTRARVRGFYIASSRSPENVRANWNGVETINPPRHISLPDPFYSTLPTDEHDDEEE